VEQWASGKKIVFGGLGIGLGFDEQVEKMMGGFQGVGSKSNQVWLTKVGLINGEVQIIEVHHLDC
jgi:hypothetical protein